MHHLMNGKSGRTNMQSRRQSIKHLKTLIGKYHFMTKILMNRHVSLIKLLSIFVTTLLQIIMQPLITKTYLG